MCFPLLACNFFAYLHLLGSGPNNVYHDNTLSDICIPPPLLARREPNKQSANVNKQAQAFKNNTKQMGDHCMYKDHMDAKPL